MSQPQPPLPDQPTACNELRRFNATQIHRFEDSPTKAEARRRVASLIRAVKAHPTASTEIVVGIAAHWLEGLVDDDHARNIVPWERGRMRPTDGDVLVQITSDTETGRLYGLRLVRAMLECARLESELLGSTRLGGREAFGYPTGSYPLNPVPRPPASSVTSQTWPVCFALYQRWVQDVDGFFALHPDLQDQVIGKDRQGNMVFAADSHVEVSRAQGAGSASPLLRRNFRYRDRDEEGLAAVILAAGVDPIRNALRNMLGQGSTPADALLRHAKAVEGGLYAIVQDVSWLSSAPLPAPGPLPAAVQDLARKNDYFLYELTQEAFAYLEKLRGEMLEDDGNGGLTIAPDIKPLVDALHHKLAGGDVNVTLTGIADQQERDLLDQMLQQSFMSSNAVNSEYGYYVTISA